MFRDLHSGKAVNHVRLWLDVRYRGACLF